MSFWKQLLYRISGWLYGRNGVDQIALVALMASLLLQLLASLTGLSLFLLLSVAIYVFVLFRIFSKKSYARQAENTKFVNWLVNLKTKLRQFFLRLKLRKQYIYFRCPQCRTLLRAGRGQGEKEMHCPKCGNAFTVKTGRAPGGKDTGKKKSASSEDK